MIRFLHTGDLHLDAPFRGLGPERARQRREEQRQVLERIADLVRDREIGLVLIAGDLFDGEGVYYETTQMLVDRLGAIPARVFIAPGNHDPFGENSPYAAVRWPENVHIFKSEYFQRVELPELKSVVYGTAFTSKYRDHSPLEHFKPDYDEGLCRLMVLHGDLGAARSRYGALTADALAATGMDYVALGHIHRHGGVERRKNTAWAYCGCPEGRGFDECGEKGVLIGEAEPGNVKVEFVPLAGRRYEEIEVDITDRDVKEALLGAVPADSRNHIYRFRLVGERTGALADGGALAGLVKDKCFDAQVVDATLPAMDLWARLEEDTLAGMFLRNMKKRMATATPEELPLLERAVRFGLCALEGREEPR